MRARITSLVAAALIITSAVAVNAKNSETRGKIRARFINNFVTDPQSAATVDVRLGRNPDPAANPVKLKSVDFGDITQYLRLRRPVTVGVFDAGTTTQLFALNLGGPRNQRATLLAEPQSSAGGAFFVQALDDST